MSAQQQTIRRFVWTGAIASVTATGAWYGAGLKTQKEIKEVNPLSCSQLLDTNIYAQVIEKRREATPEEKIAQLEEQRGALIAKRLGLEKKIQEVDMRAAGATRAESMVGKERKR
jgi:hypothetical protein